MGLCLLQTVTDDEHWQAGTGPLYALLDQVIAHPSGHRGSGITPDRRTLQVVEIAAREALSPVERLELALHPWVGFAIMPLFALDAGMPISGREFASPVALAVFAGFVIGKPVGVVVFSWVAVRAGIVAIRPPAFGCWVPRLVIASRIEH